MLINSLAGGNGDELHLRLEQRLFIPIKMYPLQSCDKLKFEKDKKSSLIYLSQGILLIFLTHLQSPMRDDQSMKVDN